jgi:cyclophilin family peptidyl-prolyl cis-trans isomerase
MSLIVSLTKRLATQLVAGVLLIGVVAGSSFAASKSNPQVEIQTSQGNFVIELYPEKAPKTVANFLQYVNSDFYKGTIFHRVINNFMIQGGGFMRDLTEKPTNAPIANEANNGLLNELGTIAMARTNDPDSATSQFFVNLTNNQFLNYSNPSPELMGYCVFGKVISGLDVVQKIGITPTTSVAGYSDVPVKAITIKSVKVINAKSTE